MKNLIFAIAFATGLFTTNANASSVNETVLTAFKSTFSCVNTVSWSEFGSFYIAQFKENNIQNSAVYDTKGELVRVVRSYNENSLLPAVVKNLKKEYKEASIYGIEEITEGSHTFFEISLYDANNFYFVKATTEGAIELVNHYKRGEI